jgi:hypothetical protein
VTKQQDAIDSVRKALRVLAGLLMALAEPSPSVAAIAAAAGGRPPADWWEDLLIDLCFKHFHGELPHQKQADIVRAMQDWIAAHGYGASESTIKLRARKLADAIKRDETAGN